MDFAFTNNVLALTAGSASLSLKVKLPDKYKLPDWSPVAPPLSVEVITVPLALILPEAVIWVPTDIFLAILAPPSVRIAPVSPLASVAAVASWTSKIVEGGVITRAGLTSLLIVKYSSERSSALTIERASDANDPIPNPSEPANFINLFPPVILISSFVVIVDYIIIYS